jgi:O-Antigen ligase
MPHTDLAHSAAVLGAIGTVPLLLGRARLAILSGLALLTAAEVALAVALVPASDLSRIESTARIGALVAAAVAVLVLASVLTRYPGVATVLLLAAAPFRITVTLGSQHAMLLLPLYGVLAAAVLAFTWKLIRSPSARPISLWLAAPSAGLIGLYGLSLLWTRDVHAGSIELLFFLFPFAAIVATVARGACPRWLPRALAVTMVGEALIFAAVGLWQEATHHVFFSRYLEVANVYTTYFRVNSLFYDPNIYARHLVLALAVLLVALWRKHVGIAYAAVAGAILWFGLYYSYSQSGLVALFVVVVAVTLASADRRRRRIVATATAGFVLIGAGLVAANVKGQSARSLTSGRSHLVAVAGRVFIRHPFVGVGVGAQPLASRELAKSITPTKGDVSHTTPVTVAAELGILGLAAYLAWLVGAAAALRDGWRHDSTIGLGTAAVFFVLLVHSLFYSGFFEDPITWGTLAFAAAFAAARSPSSAH